MANIISHYSEGEVEFSIYTKGDLTSKLGVKRTVYDIIHEGDIEESILWIIKVRANTEEDTASTISQFLKENKDEIILANIGGLMKSKISLTKDDNGTCKLSWIKEYNIMKDAGFVDVRFATKIDGFMSSNMIYSNDKSEVLLDKLKSKKLVME